MSEEADGAFLARLAEWLLLLGKNEGQGDIDDAKRLARIARELTYAETQCARRYEKETYGTTSPYD